LRVAECEHRHAWRPAKQRPANSGFPLKYRQLAILTRAAERLAPALL
jgi:hypothetical protein